MVNEYGSIGDYDPATGTISYSPGSAFEDYAWGGSAVGSTIFIADAWMDAAGVMHYPSYEAPEGTSTPLGGAPAPGMVKVPVSAGGSWVWGYPAGVNPVPVTADTAIGCDSLAGSMRLNPDIPVPAPYIPTPAEVGIVPVVQSSPGNLSTIILLAIAVAGVWLVLKK